MVSNQSRFSSSFTLMWILSLVLLVVSLLQIVRGYPVCPLKFINETKSLNLSSIGFLDVRVKTRQKDGVTKMDYYVVYVNDKLEDYKASGSWPYHPIDWDSDNGLVLDPNIEFGSKNGKDGNFKERLTKKHLKKISTLRHLFLIHETTDSGKYDIIFLRRDPFIYGLQMADFKSDGYYISEDDFSRRWKTQLRILNFTSEEIGSQFFCNNTLYLNKTRFWNKTAVVRRANINCSELWKEDKEGKEKYINLGQSVDDVYNVRWYKDGVIRFYNPKNKTCAFRYHLDHQIDKDTRIIYRQPIIKPPNPNCTTTRG